MLIVNPGTVHPEKTLKDLMHLSKVTLKGILLITWKNSKGQHHQHPKNNSINF